MAKLLYSFCISIKTNINIIHLLTNSCCFSNFLTVYHYNPDKYRIFVLLRDLLVMKNLSPETVTKYELFLKKRSIPGALNEYYKKWLRYYLDFCEKYGHPYMNEKSLMLFLDKLKNKNQLERDK